ncbi:MAG TPA: fumarylacetoacetate hydrolase family protein [Geminicoccaceae bacterium]
MARYVIEVADRPALPVHGQDGLFPVHRVFCVGRNYAEHAREMGHDPDREPPFFFGKDAAALTGASEVAYPPATADLHHEIELVVALKAGGRNIAAARARELIYGYAVGIDLTRRDLQAVAKKLARPWYLAKSFIGAAPVGPIHPVEAVGHPREGAIRLEVDSEVRQDGDLAQMIWGVEEMIQILSEHDLLLPGDLIMTGTPAGVGPVRPRQRMTGSIAGLGAIEVTMTGEATATGG